MSKRNVSCITTNKIVTATIDDKRKRCKPSPLTPITPTTIISTRMESSINVLIVDDNSVNLNILKKHLYYIFDQKLNKLKEASNGIEALGLLDLYTFDLILLDIDMPILNGVETAKKIRESSLIPIIAITTNDSIKSRETYLSVGMVKIILNTAI
jgi:CheY-like chemotaxis protein